MARSLLLDLQMKTIDSQKESIHFLTQLAVSQSWKNVEEAKKLYDTALSDRKEVINDASYSKLAKMKVDDKCYATLTHLVEKEASYMHDVNNTMSQYEGTIKQALVSMDLAYQMNKIATISTQDLNKIVINSPTYTYLSNHLSAIRSTIKTLTDLKALVATPPMTEDDELTQVCNYFNSEPLIKDKLLTTTTLTISPYYRLENIRPVKSMVARDLGFTNVEVIDHYKKLQLTARDLEQLRLYWFTEYLKHQATSPKCRVTQVLESLLTSYKTDEKLGFYTAAKLRVRRLEQATKILTSVIYPMMLSEITSYTDTLKTLGQYKALTPTTKKLGCESHSPIEDARSTFFDYLYFANDNSDSKKTYTYIPKALSSALNSLKTLTRSLEISLSQYQKTPAQVQVQDLACYPITNMTFYMERWSNVFTCCNDIFGHYLNTTKPVISYETLSLSQESFKAYQENLASVLKLLEVESSSTNSVIYPTVYSSSYRDNIDRKSHISVQDLGYASKSLQDDLFKKGYSCLETLYDLTKTLDATYKVVQKFPKTDRAMDPTTLSIIYQTLSDVIQFTSLCQHDVKVISCGRLN